MAFNELEPFGEERADLRMAILAAVIANASRTKRGSRRYRPKDFMPKFGRTIAARRQPLAQMVDLLRRTADAKNRMAGLATVRPPTGPRRPYLLES